MTATPTLALWVDGVGRSRSELEAALIAAVRLAGPGVEIVGLVGAEERTDWEALGAAGVRMVELPNSDDADVLNDLLSTTRSDWVLWIDSSARLASSALPAIGAVVGRFDVDVVYGDCELTTGQRIRRPAFSPLRLRSQDYLGDIRGFRVGALRGSGGFGAHRGGAHPLDLVLRLGARAERVVRVPRVLCVSTAAIVQPTECRRRVVARFLEESGTGAAVEIEGEKMRVRYPLRVAPLVSIIIPTRGSRAWIRGSESILVVDAVRGILERSTYSSIEFVVVADDETPQAVVDQLVSLAGDSLRLVRWSEAFNFSAKMNRGAAFARGDFLLLLNDDVDVISPDWIEILLGLAQQSAIGLVGTLLLFEDGTVQHGGHVYSQSWAGHIAFGWSPGRDDALGSLGVEREVSGVTAACAMIRADTFWEVGGFSLAYAGNYNDVDLSLKVRATGRSVVWTPHARLYHFESKSRVATVEPAEIATLRAHWGTRLLADPYWPSNRLLP